MADKKKDKKEGKEKGGSNTKPAIIIAVAILLGFKMFGGGGAAPAPAAAPAHEEEMDCAAEDIKNPVEGGPVLALDAMNVNLAEGHYLRVTAGVEFAEGTDIKVYDEEGMGAKAADAIISTVGGRSMEEFSTQEDVEALREALTEKIRPVYKCKATKVLFIEFVMQ